MNVSDKELEFLFMKLGESPDSSVFDVKLKDLVYDLREARSSGRRVMAVLQKMYPQFASRCTCGACWEWFKMYEELNYFAREEVKK